MKHSKETIVISLGGSIIVSKNVHTYFLERFRMMLLPLLKEKRIVLVVGGGSTARNYQQAAAKISHISDEDKDWIGIHCTRLNAQLLRTIFVEHAHPVLLDNPQRPITQSDWSKYSLFIASGWRPGCSTDYIAFFLAHRFHANGVLIATKVPYVYDSDVAKHPHAKPLYDLTWKKYRKMVGNKWIPGMKAPVDPIAARYGQEKKMHAIVVRGTEIKNLRRAIVGGKFRGTIIHP